MPLEIVRNDITKMKVDAIVNAANSSLLGGGGVDGCIHRAAGPGLLEECRVLGGCEVGRAKVTGAYRLPCRYVIHTVGPVWQGGGHGEREALSSCYQNSLALAKKLGLETVAFPLISSGIYGYPKDRALKAAVDEIGNFLLENDMTVYLVVFDKSAFRIGAKLFSDISEFIDDNYVSENEVKRGASFSTLCRTAEAMDVLPISKSPESELRGELERLDESFSEMLLRKIDEKGMKDSECYKKANIDKRHFSKIRKDRLYKPKKNTALAFAVALELGMDETRELLEKAGFALSRSQKLDVIVEYFIVRGIYNIFEINEALFAFDQPTLGGE